MFRIATNVRSWPKSFNSEGRMNSRHFNGISNYDLMIKFRPRRFRVDTVVKFEIHVLPTEILLDNNLRRRISGVLIN